VCNAWPDTFQLFLPTYWLDALDPFQAVGVMRQVAEDVEAALSGLSEAQLTWQPADGSWSIRNVITHMRDAQELLARRVTMMIEQDNPALSSQAVFEWATNEESRPPSTLELFESFRSTRKELLARLENLPLKDWWRGGYHEEFGPVTIRQQVSYFATHDVTHLPQIAALRAQAIP
jgi:uncharacterized damage-inducible protein DinB